jgi:hypothetical protein
VRFQSNYYSYRLERHTTLTLYSRLAKTHRYGKATVLPELMDFISQSNSQTVRMRFERGELRAEKGESAHMLSISVEPSLLGEFEQAGYLFGVKVSLNRRFLFMENSTELFQSLDKGSPGCLDAAGQWHDRAAFYRRTISAGRLKIFVRSGVTPECRLVALA